MPTHGRELESYKLLYADLFKIYILGAIFGFSSVIVGKCMASVL